MFVGFFVAGFLGWVYGYLALLVFPVVLTIAFFIDYKILIKDFGTKKTIFILVSYLGIAVILLLGYMTENPILEALVAGMYKLFGY